MPPSSTALRLYRPLRMIAAMIFMLDVASVLRSAQEGSYWLVPAALSLFAFVAAIAPLRNRYSTVDISGLAILNSLLLALMIVIYTAWQITEHHIAAVSALRAAFSVPLVVICLLDAQETHRLRRAAA